MNYGITGFGQHYIIKIRARLLTEDRNAMRVVFSQSLHIRKTMKGFTLIEGCLPFREYTAFREMLDVAMLSSKIAVLEEKKHKVLNPSYKVHPNDADLF